MLSIVSIGPGSIDLLTPRALERIRRAQVILGNERYLSLIQGIIPSQAELIKGRMGDEVKRARIAIELARDKEVVVVSGGDAGIYGMAGLILEVHAASLEVDIEIIPGITAASAAAALLGAPLSNDFAVISLSDLLTEWKTIETRLEAFARIDLVVVIYNPSSKTRIEPLKKAQEIFLKYRKSDTLVGIVRNAERANCEVKITTLAKLQDQKIDMSTLIIVGSSSTKLLGRKMVTSRGYQRKYAIPKP